MKPVLAITMGDAAGIGPEVVAKALLRHPLHDICRPVVIGDREAMQGALTLSGFADATLRLIASPEQARGDAGVVELLDMGLLSPRSWEYGKVSPLCGEASFRYIEKGIALANERRVHAVVTGPISKEAIRLAGYPHAGHTEIFAERTNAAACAMLLCSPRLRVIHCTTHVPMRTACEQLSAARVLEVIRLADEAMRLLGTEKARIGVAGLNPHASENGLFGDEERLRIIPAIERARQEGLCVEGPVPPDTVFVKAMGGLYDIVVAMYHDQGHIPVKLSGFELDAVSGRFVSVSGVNTTIGLPIIRTSVDHGTAFDRAGQCSANEQSMVDAIAMAAAMAARKFNLGACGL